MADIIHFQQLENSVNLLAETLTRNDKRLYSLESSLVELSRLMASMEEKMDRVLRLQPLAAPSSPPTGFVTASQTPDSSSSTISSPLSVPITKPYEVINPPQHPIHPISSFHSNPIIPLPHPPLIRVNLPQPSTSLQPRSGMSVISRSLSGFPARKPPAQNASAVQPMDCVYSRGDCVDRFNNSLKETGRSTGYANAQRTELFVTTSVRLHGRPPPTLVPLYCSLSAMVSLAGNFHSNQQSASALTLPIPIKKPTPTEMHRRRPRCNSRQLYLLEYDREDDGTAYNALLKGWGSVRIILQESPPTEFNHQEGSKSPQQKHLLVQAAPLVDGSITYTNASWISQLIPPWPPPEINPV